MKDKPTKHLPPNVPAERPGPQGGKRDANRREKVQRLCDASLELFCERGVASVTIDEVVAKANVSKGSFYRYFSGKEELVETIFAPLAKSLQEAFANTQHALEGPLSSEDLTQEYVRLATALASLLVSNLSILRLYLQENRGPDAGSRRPIIRVARDIEAIAITLTKVARDQGLLLRNYDLTVQALTSLGAVERLLFAYVRGDDLPSPARVSADLIGVILDGMRA